MNTIHPDFWNDTDNATELAPEALAEVAGPDWDAVTDEDLLAPEASRWQTQARAGRRHHVWLATCPDAGADVARR